jgi:cell division protease FtsH
MGLTGADVERIVREARLKARREKRPLTYRDLEDGVRGHRPPLPHDVRWRLAMHEAGHAVVHHALRLGSIKALTIDSTDGGRNDLSFTGNGPDTSAWYERLLALLLAGRAAELISLKSASAGSGGAEQSDLARATRIALEMEQTLGFGIRHPLLYLEHKDPTAILSLDADLANRVHQRLEFAQARATEVILENRAAFETLARALFDAQALEGQAVMDILLSTD